MKTINCNIPSKDVNYEIWIGSGLLKTSQWIEKIKPLANRFVILTDDHLLNSVGNTIYNTFKEYNLKVDLFAFPPGEAQKNRQTKQQLEDCLLDAGCGRDTALIALGGGVVTDIGGFIASTYNRGIPLIMIPTSLLAMVDASIGGKNGIDVPQGKNLIGTFYQPKYVFIDPEVLQTLPVREFRNGLVEMIKHALITDVRYFQFFEQNVQRIMNLDPHTLEQAIYDSCIIKKSIVEEDEKETGKRRLLNCGHTLAHAIEHLTHYTIAHGEAVAIGIVLEAYLSNKLGYLSQNDFQSIVNLFLHYGIPLKELSDFEPAQILKAVVLDKKSVKGQARYVLLKAIGTPLTFNDTYCTPIDDQLLLESLTWYSHVMCHN